MDYEKIVIIRLIANKVVMVIPAQLALMDIIILTTNVCHVTQIEKACQTRKNKCLSYKKISILFRLDIL